jgi:DNA-binding CsgD family transcriptional regulator
MKEIDEVHHAEDPIKELIERGLITKFDEVEFEEMYKNNIQILAESPYMFNYYHWVSYFPDKEIRNIVNLKKMLGHDEGGFDFEKSQGIIHANFRPFVVEYAKTTFNMLCDKKYRMLGDKAHYSIQFPVKHNEGHYVLVQMNVSIIRVNDLGYPIALYNRFEVLGKYFNSPILIKPRIFFRTKMDLTDMARAAEKDLTQKVSVFMLNHLGFTKSEMALLKKLSDDLSIKNIAIELGNISEETVKVHNKNILNKARGTLSPLFTSAREVSHYLKDMEII